ncbi:MAG TPA: HEAT repeat domain-containing protein [Pyrinomonadaceae bacterium]
MTGNNSHPAMAVEGANAPRRRSPWPLIVVAALFIIVPFFTWYGTWFGRSLSDADIEKYLNDERSPRHVQAALTQIEERMERNDASVKRWYPRIVALAFSPVAELRKTAAWVMGNDNKSEEFHQTLVRLLEDSEPVVRRNAAVQLVRFNDARGRAELRAILQPFTLSAPTNGTISSTLPAGSRILEGTMICRLKQEDELTREVRSPLPGKINDVRVATGAKVAAGDAILTITPDENFVYEALRALFLVGEREDLPEVLRYAEGVEGMPEQIKQQAAQTAKAIQSRS